MTPADEGAPLFAAGGERERPFVAGPPADALLGEKESTRNYEVMRQASQGVPVLIIVSTASRQHSTQKPLPLGGGVHL